MSVNGILFEPESSWVAPREFPDLSGCKRIGVDVESRDPELNTRGPGFLRGDAYVCGISLSADDRSWYFPIRHAGGGNLNPSEVARYLADLFRGMEDRWVVGANLQYELEALSSLDVRFPRSTRFLDIQIVEALLDETQEFGSYELESLSEKYLGVGKDEAHLRKAAEAYGIDPKRELWKLPAKHVGPYAMYDSSAPLKIIEKQMAQIQEQDLEDILYIESRLIPLLWHMRERGVRVDLEEAQRVSGWFMQQEDDLRLRFRNEYSREIDEWSAPMIASICDERNIPYPRTAKGNPSFTGEWLDQHDHPLFEYVRNIRELNRLRSTFIDDWIFKNQIGGFVHPQWKQLKSDEGGTKTGRMAAANPNPQQVPARSEYAEKIRRLFIPHEPGLKWAKLDYSQQEPRILVHFASLCGLTGADLVKMAYKENRGMDIYEFLAKAAQVKRPEAKNITLGRMYGMGVRKLAQRLGVSLDKAEELLRSFDEQVPFVKEISDICKNKAESRGWIKTLGGRKRHFNLWEPVDAYQMRQEGHAAMPCRRTAAEARWPKKRLQRADCHKALNSLIQGSAADMTKICMLKIWDEYGMVPYLQVHDELDYGVSDETVARSLQDVAETCVEMCVPIKADLSLGEHWK